MYKLKLFLIFIVLINLTIPFCSSKDNLYDAGIVFYKQGKYNEALKFFSEAIKENSNNDACIYYFARSLEKTNNVDYALEYYKKVIDAFPKSKFSEYAKLEITKIKRNRTNVSSPKPGSIVIDGQLISASNSYIDKLRTKVTWSSDKMPLNVFISKTTLPEFEASVWEAFEVWENESYNVLSFVRVNNANDADISIYWNNSLYNNKNTEMGGITNLSVDNGNINKAEIFLTNTDKMGRSLTPSEIKSNTMFNIGRSVGLIGNSDSQLDVMCPSGVKKDLTRRDKNTLVLIYKAKDPITTAKEPSADESDPNHEVIEIKKPKKKKNTEKEKIIEKNKEDKEQKEDKKSK